MRQSGQRGRPLGGAPSPRTKFPTSLKAVPAGQPARGRSPSSEGRGRERAGRISVLLGPIQENSCFFQMLDAAGQCSSIKKI